MELNREKKVVITGIGIRTEKGENIDIFWNDISKGEKRKLCTKPDAAESSTYDTMSRNNGKVQNYANRAIKRALEDSRLEHDAIETAGLIFVSANGSVEAIENQLNIESYPIAHSLNELLAQYGFTGPSFTVSTACASGNIALSMAYEEIASGDVEVMVVGGSEVISETILGGFNAIRAVSSEGCAPFDKNRDGIAISEGAAFLILESSDHAEKRNAKVYCELAGYGMKSDGENMTKPNGIGIEGAMETALKKCLLLSEDFDYLNAHGTGTDSNDYAEAHAISRVFQNSGNRLVVGSTKGNHGHFLGTAGLVEAIVCALAIKTETVPVSGGLVESAFEFLSFQAGESASRKLNYVMSNSQAFGGVNTALVFKRVGI